MLSQYGNDLSDATEPLLRATIVRGMWRKQGSVGTTHFRREQPETRESAPVFNHHLTVPAHPPHDFLALADYLSAHHVEEHSVRPKTLAKSGKTDAR